MDRAYESDETRYLLQSLGFEPVVPPLQTRRDPWPFDAELYKRRNEIERLFGCIKRFRRVFTRYDKTELMFSAFVTVAFIADRLCRPTGSSSTTPCHRGRARRANPAPPSRGLHDGDRRQRAPTATVAGALLHPPPRLDPHRVPTTPRLQ